MRAEYPPYGLIVRDRELQGRDRAEPGTCPDRTPPPSSLAHTKYADFRTWQAKDSYYQALPILIEALGISSSFASSEELHCGN